MDMEGPRGLYILHFNDVYNVEQGEREEPVGGAPRFVTAIKSFEYLHPLVLFSGDIFAPSMLSNLTSGEHMVPVLNESKPACAVFGNHDFDHGLEQLSKLTKLCNFPWLMSNIVDKTTKLPLGNGEISHIVEHNGLKIGIIGLVEKEWLETLITINMDDIVYTDFTTTGNDLAAELRNNGCKLIIALTHMRTPNDIKLAECCDGIDLILGGHDHVNISLNINGKWIIKSGSDFRTFSKLFLSIDDSDKIDVKIDTVNVTSEFSEDELLVTQLKPYLDLLEGNMKEVLCSFSVPLEGRFEVIRRHETNLANFISDIVRNAMKTEVAIINAGTFRSDRLHPPGDFTVRDLFNILPTRNALVVVSCSGKTLREVFENGVSKYPNMEGRLPQVSGASYSFDFSRPVGQRMLSVKINGENVDENRMYSITIKKYMYLGRDGYSMFQNCNLVEDEDMCPQIGIAVYNFMKKLKQDESLVANIPSLVVNVDQNKLELTPEVCGRITIINSNGTGH